MENTIDRVIWPDGRVMRIGLQAIADMFGVSKSTAHTYKNTFLKPAIIQRGRMIWVDEALALKLMKENGAVKNK